MTTQNGRAFNEWLRAQLRAKKMSQRQLAQQSGVGLAQTLGAPTEVSRSEEVAVLGEVLGGVRIPPRARGARAVVVRYRDVPGEVGGE